MKKFTISSIVWRHSVIRTLFLWVIPGLILGGCHSPTPEEQGELWLRFAHITDAHVCDEESPARVVRLYPLLRSSWRPHEAYSVHVLDSMLAEINAHHRENPIDFVIHTGDAVEIGQYNELRWFLDTFDGREVTVDSGDMDGWERNMRQEINPKLPYKAQGLDPSIPWYAVYGNHDGLCMGNFRIEDTGATPEERTAPLFEPVAVLIGLHLFPDMPNRLLPVDNRSPAIILGKEEPPMDPETLQIQVDQLEAGPIPPDVNRRFLTRHEFIEEHFHTQTMPLGHGFTESNRSEGHAYYNVKPRDDIPIRLIVIDTVSDAPVAGWPFFCGVMMREQFDNFMKTAVYEAQGAGEYVIIVSHHPSSDFNIPHPGLTVSTCEFRRFLASQPNVLAHICGHTHIARVQTNEGCYPYPEIVTSPLIDYPQEGRIIEVYRLPEAGRFRIQSTIISHREQPTSWSEEGFRRAKIYSDYIRGRIAESSREGYFRSAKPSKLGLCELTSPCSGVTDVPINRKSERDFSILLTPRQ